MFTSISVIREKQQTNDKKSVKVKYETAQGDEVVRNFRLDSHVNSDDYALSQSQYVIDDLKQQELKQLEKLVNSNVPVEQIISSFRYVTMPDALIDVVNRGATLVEVERLVNLEGIITYMLDNFTAQNVVSMTGLDESVVNLFFERVSKALEIKDQVKSINGSALNG
jgi:hypothetical protein